MEVPASTSGSSLQPRASPDATPARRRRAPAMRVAGLAVLALLGGLAASVHLRLGWASRMLAGQLAAASGDDRRVVVVVVGTDRRAHDPGRTDAILVASLDVDTGRVGVLSIPRDTRVRVPGRGYNKVNLIYPVAGPQALVQTLSALLDIPIDGYVRVDFEAFVRVVDALGGVEVTVERPMHYVDRAQGLFIDLPAGHQRLDGRRALDYVRYRGDGLGDVSYDPGLDLYRGRIERQQQFVRALVEAALRPATLWALPRIVRDVYGLVETDLSPGLALAAAAYLVDRRSVTLKTAVLPGRPGEVAGASYWLPDMERARLVVREVLGGAPGPARRAASSQVAVAVLNANGIDGSAARVARELRAGGVPVALVGNASTFSQARTWVWARSSESLPAALRVARLLGVTADRVRLAGSGDGGPAGDGPGAEVVVLVGRDLAGPPGRAGW